MKIGVIIFSRFDSSRLPGKALIDIGGRPLLGRVIDRAKQISNIDSIVIATSDRTIDDAIAQFAESEKVGCYRGSLDNVALRALEACDASGFDGFVRVCGDRPFFDTDVIDQLLVSFKEQKLDLATTTGDKPLPPGLTGEAVKTSALHKIIMDLDSYDKEHVTSFFYRNQQRFNIKAIPPPSYINSETNIRLVVDDELDLERARWIASNMTDVASGQSYILEIISLAKRWDMKNTNTSA